MHSVPRRGEGGGVSQPNRYPHVRFSRYIVCGFSGGLFYCLCTKFIFKEDGLMDKHAKIAGIDGGLLDASDDLYLLCC